MAICPITKWQPLPENKTEPAIIPTQIIIHTMWGTLEGTGDYFKRSDIKLESHFGTGFGGEAVQWIDTERQADANYKANVRAISIENEDGRAIVPFSKPQLRKLIEIVDWCCTEHNIPRVLCPTWDSPGIGWHVMFGAPGPWTPVAKSCPGTPRIKQIRDIIVPEVARMGRVKEKEETVSYLEENLTREELDFLIESTKQNVARGVDSRSLSSIVKKYREARAYDGDSCDAIKLFLGR